MNFGDLLVIGEPGADLLRAFQVIGATLHQAYDRHPRIVTGKSRRSCVLCALTVRDFLMRIGFDDAQARPVGTYMAAFEGRKMLHSLAIGLDGGGPAVPGHWSGHLVATARGWLIDTTLYPAQRPQWSDLPGMIALPLNPIAEDRRLFGKRSLAQFEIAERLDALGLSEVFQAAWLDDPDNIRWRRGPDARDSARRSPVLRAMLDAWERG